ncbi:AAA family ATPase [Comamonas sp. Tr-654]|uniref:AAA family ATPase n=1 Tax=Comamonas sp. Tr-654 TaxID=2608341 RepID=UPI0014204BE5|nr:AAA family ATPase [Comamonas sp. Tr-654]NIF82657.1 AAA family ATPase [Comamonas sp. Tr-654]
MKLRNVRVTNFRSIEDSEAFDIDQVVCLVGKNEAGKSALLSALAALNPHPLTPAKFDKERDYPRRYLTQYDERHPKDNPAVAIATEWELDEAEIAEIEESFGEGCILPTVQILRSYEKDTAISVSPKFDVVLPHLYETYSLAEEEISSLAECKTSTMVLEALKDREVSGGLAELKKWLSTNVSVTTWMQAYIRSKLPKFMYVSSYDRMDGAVRLDLLQQLSADQLNTSANQGKKLFLEFLQYAGISLEKVTNQQTFESYNAVLQSASNRITDQILEYWTQNPDLSVEVTVDKGMPGDAAPFNDGMVARARIFNSLHRVDTPFSERSAGFVWFFSFLVKFAQVQKAGEPVILLLDEPGLTLHGKAQADLMKFFEEKLAPYHQVIYSTHSPFMVPAHNLAAVRVVQDIVQISRGGRRTPIGTKVRDDVLTNDPDTLFPLQAALGYELTQSLFVGENTLLVEGPGDILYIQALSDALRQLKRSGLDERWTMCPAGGIDKIRPFATLFAGTELNIAVLSDQAAGDRRKVDDLRKAEILKAGQFHTIAELLDVPEADIEDLFTPALFVDIVNATYGLTGKNKLTVDKLNAAATTPRLVKKAEAYFNVLPANMPTFSHFAPAAWLVRHAEMLDPANIEVAKTLDTAEQVFKVFNELLPR